MTDSTCATLHRPPPSDAERQRIRELARYYGTIRNAPRTTEHDNVPALSPDITLNALTQLAIYRFKCNRAFVSLIDDQNQHIIAETTASISLRDREKHSSQDGIYLGTTTLDLVFGVCPEAVKLFTGQPVSPALQNSDNMTADRTRFIVRDFSKHDHYKDRPYVTDWPYFRFYAEVPIYSPSGYVLGSFCVVDDKPRREFSDDEVVALQEISDSISQHLENIRIVHSHKRSDRLIHGLTSFAQSGSEFCESSISKEQQVGLPAAAMPNLIANRQASQSGTQASGIDGMSPFTELTEAESSQFDQTPSAATEFTTLPPASPRPNMIRTISALRTDKALLGENVEKGGDYSREEAHLANAPVVAVKENATTSKRIAAIFSHASDLLRDSMDLDGVLFLDAGRCNSGIVASDESVDWEPFPRAVDPELTTYSSLPSRRSKESFCDTLGSAFRNTEHEEPASQSTIRESLLQNLVTAFPYGEVFDLEDASAYVGADGLDKDNSTHHHRTSSQAGHASSLEDRNLSRVIASRLLDHFPTAKSVIFLPLCDWDRSEWVAGTFLWTEDADRALGLEELHYFKAFGDCILSEVARVNWSKQEVSKSSFISSISHELRSPLHGMLASAELLSGTPLQPDQRDIVKMLETCGLTLLDTMTHLLDFTKINNLTTMKKDTSGSPNASIPNLVSNFDLATLLEEVVNTMYLGRQYTTSATQMHVIPGSQSKEPHASTGSELSVVVRIDRESQWTVQSTTGAWRRIIMNILGNALKYTQQGFVEVSLSHLRQPSDSNKFVTHLSVTDSGCGMSQEFLRNKLFSPFTQENHLSEGVGLGLSIVHQLVTLLEGTIDLRSELGVGTQVDVFIPVQYVTLPPHDPSAIISDAKPTKFCLIGFQAYSDLTEEPTGTLGSDAKRRLCIQSFLKHLVTSQRDWSVTFAETFDGASGEVAILEESTLAQIADGVSMEHVAGTKFDRFVVLDNALASAALVELSSRADVVQISQPLCPQKVLNVLKRIVHSDSQPAKQPDHAGATLPIMVPDVVGETEGFKSPDLAPKHEPIVIDTKPLVRSQSDSANIANRHVLIVDDNPINVKVLSKFMSKLGWTFDTAVDGLKALNKYKESPGRYRVLLMDISMPVMDGVVATRHVRAFEKENLLPSSTIFAITGVGSSTMKQQALSAGVDDYMIKPLSLQQLSAAMKRIQHEDLVKI